MDSNLKKNLDDEWLKYFPELRKYKPGKLYKTLGPLVVGIELIRLRNGPLYRPHFVVYPLWPNRFGSDLQGVLRAPLILANFRDNNGLFLSLPLDGSNYRVDEAAGYCRSQSLFELSSDVTLNELSIGVKRFHHAVYNNASSSAHQIYSYDLLFNCALYLGRPDLAVDILQTIDNASIGWDKSRFNWATGGYVEWRASLNDRLKNPDIILKSIEINLSEPTISRLGRSNLLYSDSIVAI